MKIDNVMLTLLAPPKSSGVFIPKKLQVLLDYSPRSEPATIGSAVADSIILSRHLFQELFGTGAKWTCASKHPNILRMMMCRGRSFQTLFSYNGRIK